MEIKCRLPKNILAITIFPVILVNYLYDMTAAVRNHERIHLKQQLETLVIPFYLWYGIEFLIRWGQYKNFDAAYRNISFEREAYSNDENLNYLSSRKLFSFFKYLRNERQA